MKTEVSKFMKHPWHGIDAGAEAPDLVTAFIEIVSSDTIKYEIDKTSGWLKVDRPQQFSNIFPGMYGFIPSTYCGAEVGNYCAQKSGKEIHFGDKDPLDICIITEKVIPRNGILVKAIPIGGFRLIDKNEADDKIIAVLKGDELYEHFKDIHELPSGIINRLKHYFLTYKDMPGAIQPKNEITDIYGREEAQEVIKLSLLDYKNSFHVKDQH